VCNLKTKVRKIYIYIYIYIYSKKHIKSEIFLTENIKKLHIFHYYLNMYSFMHSLLNDTVSNVT
jgi:hypothetical protein